MTKTKEKPKENWLSIHIKARQKHHGKGHLGRDGEEIQAVAAAAGMSVHQVQSLAMGRRKFSDSSLEKLKEVVRDRKQGAAA